MSRRPSDASPTDAALVTLVDAANTKAERAAGYAVVLARFATLRAETLERVDFCRVHEQEFWNGVSDMADTIAKSLIDCKAAVATLHEATKEHQGGAR